MRSPFSSRHLSHRLATSNGVTCRSGYAMHYIATFSRIVVKILRGLDDFSGAYLDDIINFSQSWRAHADHLRTVLTRVRDAHLTESDQVSVRRSRPRLPRPPHWSRSGPTSLEESRGTARLSGSPEQETAPVVPGTFQILSEVRAELRTHHIRSFRLA